MPSPPHSSFLSRPPPPPDDGDVLHAGFIFASIVDLNESCYTASFYGTELATLVLNPRDPNAINVVVTTGQLLGHIERPVSALLSPLIDSGFITVEAIIPKQPWSWPWDSAKLVCQVHITTRPDSVDTARFLIEEADIGFYPRSAPFFARAEAAILKLKQEKTKKNNNNTQIETGTETHNLNDQIFASLPAGGHGGSANADGGGNNRQQKIAEPPKDVVSTELFLHQKQGLAWLIQRENSCESPPPFWEWWDTGFYVNVLTGSQTRERPEGLQGGIFADDMGMGKTLTLLSLIAANRPGIVLVPPFIEIDHDHDIIGEEASSRLEKLQDGQGKVTHSEITTKSPLDKSGKRVAAGSRRKRKIHDFHVEEEEVTIYNSKKSGVEKSGKRASGSCNKNRKTEDDQCGDIGPKTTLIVCPPTVLSTWIAQIKEHTIPGSLKVYEYHGRRTSDVEELQRFDIVLTTYSTLSSEKNYPESPIKKIEWWRIILDEAHVIRNVTAQQSQAVMHLKGKRRWVVTGTPIQNGSFDLFPLMAFLRLEPFSIKRHWESLVQRPLSKGRASGLSCLKTLMRIISLRRTKDLQMGTKSLVALPPKTVETCFVELSTEERRQYDHMESEARMVVGGFVHADSAMRNYSTILYIILRLRQICNCVELCPSNIGSLCPTFSLGDIANNPELQSKMVSILKDGDDVECAICLSLPTEAVITSCAHIFCKHCILKALQWLKPCCPLCRNPLVKSDLFSASPPSPNEDSPTSSSVKASSKVSMLLRFLVSSREESPSIKSVIFSQFRKMLILLEEPLKTAGFQFLRLDGLMTAKKRAEIIKEFGQQRPESPTVLLASLKAAGAGINLTAASRAYLLEPWWNPGVEQQAMDRLHRIGQKNAVKVVRLIVKNSIEERILELQERKKDLTRIAFGKKNSEELRQMRLDELRTIMRL